MRALSSQIRSVMRSQLARSCLCSAFSRSDSSSVECSSGENQCLRAAARALLDYLEKYDTDGCSPYMSDEAQALETILEEAKDKARAYAEGFVAGGSWPQRPTICIGRETLARLRKGEAVRLEEADLVAASDLPAFDDLVRELEAADG